jgi:hypothetical protein
MLLTVENNLSVLGHSNLLRPMMGMFNIRQNYKKINSTLKKDLAIESVA